jgi:hypothetical protein
MGWFWTASSTLVLLAGAWTLARDGFRQPPGFPRLLGTAILAWAWVTLGVEILGNLGLLRDLWLVGWSGVLGLVALGIRGYRGRLADERTGDVTRDQRAGWVGMMALGLVLWGWMRVAFPSLVAPVKVVSDGPIYHLYMAARWWKAGRLFLVPTPFGDVGATYFWANGELYYAWLMTLLGGDRLAKVGQAPFYGVAIVAAVGVARRLGASVPSAWLAAAWFAACGPFMTYSVEPNVDALFVAGYLTSVFFFLRFTMEDDVLGSLTLGALAAGLCLGTKPTGVVFVPPLLTLALLTTWRRSGTKMVKLGRMGVIFAATALTMGYWPARNWLLTGNPLYPIQVELFGRVWLEGWFGPEVMSRSYYYIPITWLNALWDILVAILDPRLLPVWVASLAGAWAIGRNRTPHARWVWGIAALALLNVALYWLVIPYRTQQRFVIHALGLAATPLALLFDRANWLRVLGLGLLALHITTPQVWLIATTEREIPWDGSPLTPNLIPAVLLLPLNSAELSEQRAKPHGLEQLVATIALGPAAFLIAWACVAKGRNRTRWTRALACIVLVGSLGTFEFARLAAPFPFPLFTDHILGWLSLDQRSGPAGARVAYAGTNIPYYLLCPGLRNEVRYVNVDAHRGWLMHDYHRDAVARGLPGNWYNPYPGWDRLRPDYDAWLANLRAEGIELLVVARVNRSEGAHNVADAMGFPIERVWAEGHPEAFEPLYGVVENDTKFRLYRVIPPENRAGSTDRGSSR